MDVYVIKCVYNMNMNLNIEFPLEINFEFIKFIYCIEKNELFILNSLIHF